LWKAVNGSALAAIICAVFVVWLFPAWQQARALPSLEDRLLSAQTAAVALRTEIESMRSLADEQTAFLSAMIGRPHLSQDLRELTIAVPDETWLSELSYSQASLVLTGETTGSAAELVLSLAEVKSFGNPRLSGPVSRSAEGGERFEVVIDHRRAD
jgi:general secretion pathway protein L